MSDRYIAYTVLLETPVRKDDAEHITHAIRMIKGVAKVTPIVEDAQTAYAERRARSQLSTALLKVLESDLPPRDQ